tara:strand:- start:783 stop:1457 length:675 start_codon:yes stop_codon:yes gene_type:complete
VLLISTNFFKNFLNVYLNNYNKRIDFTYGFCKNESIGYLKYLKNEFNLDNNPKIVNYVHTPPVEWSIIKPSKLNRYSNDIILLNYPGKILSLNYQRINGNTFEIKNLSFFANKIKKIDSILITFNKSINLEKVEIDLLSEINFGERNLVKNFNQYKQNNKYEIEFKIDLKINDLYPKNNNIAFKINNINQEFISEIKIFARNKFILENFDIVDNHNNCFLLRND